MGEKKEPNRGTLPCMVCGEPYKYLTTSHMGTHERGQPQNVTEYRDWVAQHSGLERDHCAIDSNELLKPQLWRENKDLFAGWRNWE